MQWLERARRAIIGSTESVSGSHGKSLAMASRKCRYEALEPRWVLSHIAPGLVDTPQTYSGTLNGKIVFTSGGHGWKGSGTSYTTDRPEYWRNQDGTDGNIVEDFQNQDQLAYYVDYLLRAGATVVPMRPVGRQLHEVVLDNDSAGVTFTGAWSNSTGSDYYDEDYGASADAVPYRFANTTTGTESAVATYTPSIQHAGFYPVYTWVARGTNRTAQLYRINHTGGSTEIRVDHSKVGLGWVYLGTYHFNNGSSSTLGSVQISNNGTAGKVVIADAIRFGNGMGDWIEPGATVISGKPREDENSEHWINRMLGVGTTASEAGITDNVNAPSNMAQWMFSGAFGEAVYIGFHSNGHTGDPDTSTGRGARGLIDTDVSDRTPHQVNLATWLGQQINQDFQNLNGVFEVNWTTGTTATFTGQYGELNLGSGAEMDATIIEVAFHDNVNDNLLLRDPKGRDQIARSVYQGTLQYFAAWGSPPATNTSLPTAPTNVRVVSNASGAVTLNWSAGPSSPASVYGAAATGYKVYASIDGYGFDGGRTVAGTSTTITGLDPNRTYYFRVAATNAGGESKPSEVLTALPSGGVKQVLIVSGFDRHDRGQNFRFAYVDRPDGLTDRVWSRYNNSFDYVNRVHSAIQAARPGIHVASTSNESVINGSVNLTDYQTVIWILGNEGGSTATAPVSRTLDATEQTKISQFLAAGGNLFISGAEIGWDLDQQNNGRTFYENTLKSNYVNNDAGSYTATAPTGSIFAGLGSFVFSSGAPSTGANAYSSRDDQVYDVAMPDVIAPLGGAITALNYSGGTGGGAATQFGAGGIGSGSIVMFGFPFETMTNATRRNEAMGRILGFFGYTAAVAIETRVNGQDADSPTGPVLVSGSSATFTYLVTASGNLPVTSIVVKDDNGTPGNTADDVTLTSPTGDTNSNSILDPGETWTYTANRTVAVGQQTHTGSVAGVYNGSNVSNSDAANYFGALPSISIETRVNGQNADTPTGPILSVGTSVLLTYSVMNTGSGALQDVVVGDDRGTPGNPADDLTLVLLGGDTNGNSLLDVGETWTYFVNRIVEAGQQTTTGSVTASDSFGTVVNASNPANYFGAAPSVSLTVSVNGDDANSPPGPIVEVGSDVTFTYSVTNTGDAELFIASITDDNGTPGDFGDDFNPTFNGDPNENGRIDVGETWTFTATRPAIAGQYTSSTFLQVEDSFGFPAEVSDSVNYFGQAAPPADNADFDGNDIVDALDYVLWRINEGITEGAVQGDANFDDAVNDDDYNIWAAQYGSSPGGGSAAVQSLAVESVPVVLVEESVADEVALSDAAFSLFSTSESTSRSFRPSQLPSKRAALAIASRVDWTTMLTVLAERRSAGKPVAEAPAPSADNSAAESADTAVGIDLLPEIAVLRHRITK